MLDLTYCDEISQSELREHSRVKVMDDGTVAVTNRLAKGYTIDPTYGLGSMTQSAIAKANGPGVYDIPSAEEWERESTIRATPNPWLKGTWNLTQQIVLADENPELTERFKREAGVQ